MEFISKDSQLYQNVKALNDHIQSAGEVFEKEVAKDIIRGERDLQGRGVLKESFGLSDYQLKKASYQLAGTLKQLSGLVKIGVYDLEEKRCRKKKGK